MLPNLQSHYVHPEDNIAEATIIIEGTRIARG